MTSEGKRSKSLCPTYWRNTGWTARRTVRTQNASQRLATIADGHTWKRERAAHQTASDFNRSMLPMDQQCPSAPLAVPTPSRS
jgi:hypothetical protein